MKYVPVEEFYFILFFKSSTVFVLFSLEVGRFISVLPSLLSEHQSPVISYTHLSRCLPFNSILSLTICHGL